MTCIMEQPPQIKTISAVIIIFLVLGAGFLLFLKYRTFPNPEDSLTINPSTSLGTNDEPKTVLVENTPMIDGALSLPGGFPQDIPLETGNLIESATTYYPEQNVRQLSLSYWSSRTMTEKYAEYKNYMTTSGYKITEEDTNAPVRAIFGVKEDRNLSVAISSREGKTLVQLSYLLKSAQ